MNRPALPGARPFLTPIGHGYRCARRGCKWAIIVRDLRTARRRVLRHGLEHRAGLW